jgi:DNA-binding response OmpR family regulator
MVLTNSSEKSTDIVANSNYHAIFVKDETASSYLDQFNQATSDLCQENLANHSPNMLPREGFDFYPYLVERLRNKSPNTKVIFTIKKKIPADIYVRSRKYINRTCTRLGLSPHDSELVATAGEIHNFAKFRHPNNCPGSSRTLQALNERPIIARMLGLLYCSLEESSFQQPSLDIMGANILTIADLFCDTLPVEEHLTGDTHQVITSELGNLAKKLFLKEVIDAFSAILEDEIVVEGASERPHRVLIFSNRPNRIYALKARLRHEGFRTDTAESAEAFIAIYKRQRPDIIIMRFDLPAVYLIRTINTLLSKGVDLEKIPTFLLVQGSVVNRLALLLEVGIRDIIDMDGDINDLLLRIKKIRTSAGGSANSTGKDGQNKSGSRGNLSDMNIIDLLQALGPSRRTSRITAHQKESSDPLLIYLAQGSIIFAQLGDLTGETAIHRALAWQEGTWIVEQIDESELPEPNNDLPNEAILMEGCRLMDEKARETGVN